MTKGNGFKNFNDHIFIAIQNIYDNGTFIAQHNPIYSQTKPNNPLSSMNSWPPDVHDLRKRELELRLLIRQMKLDQLHTSHVYQSLENELELVKDKLIFVDEEKSK